MARGTKRRHAPTGLNPRKLLLALAILTIPGAGLFTWHRFADEQTKGDIEIRTLIVVDLLRENKSTPRELVFWLDLFADTMPVVRGKAVRVDPNVAGSDFSAGGAPVSRFPLTVLHNTGYDVGYDESRRNPAWVSYKLTSAPKNTDADKRPSDFETDSRTRSRVPSSVYSNSGYDRGHMAPYNAIDLQYGAAAGRQTFLMSNITPQKHELNAGFWKNLEQRILHRYPRRFGEVRVTCGPVFGPVPVTLGHAVQVPESFYLIVTERDVATGEIRAQAYLVPANDVRGDTDPTDYLTDIRQVETLTGLDFYPKLPRTDQDALETAKAIKAW